MHRVKALLSNKVRIAYFLICLIIIGTIVYFMFGKKDDQYSNLDKKSFVPTIYTPTQGTLPTESEIKKEEPKTWPKDFYVIAESFTAPGSSGRTYNYGEKIVLSKEREIIENGSPTGRFVKSEEGLVSAYFYPTYQKIFPVVVDAYKKLPLDIKYKIIIKSDSFCSLPAFYNQEKLVQLLFLDEVPPSAVGYAPFDPSNCNTRFSMPKSQFMAENSISYADLDSNTNTPKHILIILENNDPSLFGSCKGLASIFAVDANGRYYRQDLAVTSICYVTSIKKGTVVPIIKVGLPGSDGVETETKSSFKMPAEAFALHLVDGSIDYLLYDKTTSTQTRIMPSRQYEYDYQYRAGVGN